MPTRMRLAERLPRAELAYVDALVSQLQSALCIDTTRIFSMGFSGGGSFSGMLGCDRTDIRRDRGRWRCRVLRRDEVCRQTGHVGDHR